MTEPAEPFDPAAWPFDLEEIRQRAEIRRTWLVGETGNPVPFCRYCTRPIPSEWAHEQEAIEHNDGCPVPEAIQRRAPDFDVLLAGATSQRAELRLTRRVIQQVDAALRAWEDATKR